MLASAAQISVSLDQKIYCVDMLLDSVILKNDVLASLVTVQRIVTSRMDLHVIITPLIATQESARLMTPSAKCTS